MNNEQINECLTPLFGFSVVFALIFLIAALQCKSEGAQEGSLEKAYKYAMWGALTLFVSLIILLTLNATR
jgi:hypothetical protein